jgi:hypothetical protein
MEAAVLPPERGHGIQAARNMLQLQSNGCIIAPGREVILEIPGNFVLKRLSSDHNLPVDLFPRHQPLIEVG